MICAMSAHLPLRIFKTSPTGWRTNLGGAHVGAVPAWNVEDAHGTLLAGGLRTSGNNVESARARFRLKREAVAYAMGYGAWLQGELSEQDLAGGMVAHATIKDIGDKLGWRGDERMEAAYKAGVIEARNHQRRALRPAGV